MLTVQEVICQHLGSVLKIRDREQVFIHNNNSSYTDVGPKLIIATITTHPFLRITINDESVTITAKIPKAIPTYNFDTSPSLLFQPPLPLKPAPKNPKHRAKWRKTNINLMVVYSNRNLRDDLQCGSATFDLHEPRSIHMIEYCCNNIITTMVNFLYRGYSGLCLKDGISHDFNLITNATERYLKKHT